MLILRRAIPSVLCLALVACGGGDEGGGTGLDENAPPIAESISFIDIVLPLTPAVPNARHAAKVDDCVWSGRRFAPCNFSRLPTIYAEDPTPTVDTVMGRVVTSHPWMATRFRELLTRMPADMLLLFRPVTGIVISNDVRPAFYWAYTGAIYLDPAYLWVSAEERAQLDTTPDFRSDFGASLQFTMPWRYVKDDAYAYPNPAAGLARPIEYAERALADLLFHELAHANDFVQPSQLANIRSFDSVYDIVTRSATPRVGDLLANALPLQSNTMTRLAQVRFQGVTATSDLTALTPELVHPHFSPDGANDWYNYTSRAEDVAMLFEETMMLRHYGIDRDVAVANKPAVPNPTAADYVVAWGVRNRIGTPQVKARARFVAQVLLPEAQLVTFFDALPAPTPMTPGGTWLANLVLGPASSAARHKAEREAADQPVEELPVGY
jgi:hypothetical protein